VKKLHLLNSPVQVPLEVGLNELGFQQPSAIQAESAHEGNGERDRASDDLVSLSGGQAILAAGVIYRWLSELNYRGVM
jgi:hypothetical protein